MLHKTILQSPRLTFTVSTILASLIIGGIMSQSIADGKLEVQKEKHLRHVVLYKFKPEITPQQIQEVVEAFAALPEKIDTIIGFERGVNVSEENKSDGFTHCFVVTFRDTKGREAYLKHPAHDAYVKVVKDRREKVIVFDYWAER